MKNRTTLILLCLIGAFTLNSCSVRLVDFTAISSKNVDLNIDRSQGVKVKGSKVYFLGIGWNIKDPLDEALEGAGPEYDLLIDGVVRYTSYPYFAKVTVEGTAVNSSAMKRNLGEVAYKEWIQKQDLLTEATVVAE